LPYINPVINETCKQAQFKRLENQSKASKISLNQAIAQTRFILENSGKDRTAKHLSGPQKIVSR
jgi:type II secretory pathway component PulC